MHSRRIIERLRGLQPAARAEAAARRRVSVVLPDGHADDPRERDVDGAVPREADHAAGADARRWRARDRRGPSRPPHRARDAPTSSARWSTRSTPWLASSPAAGSKLERSRIDLERKNLEVEGRRRYIETILERIATGVVSIDAAGRVSTINTAAARLLGLDIGVIGPAGARSVRPARPAAARPLMLRRRRGVTGSRAGDRAGARRPRGPPGGGRRPRCRATAARREGAVLVFDDVTPLIRAQRVSAWRDVARRLAHEIKNPLTPIQLCAERLRRHFTRRPSPPRELVDECTGTIVGEVEIAQGAGRRVLAVRPHAGAAHGAVGPPRARCDETLALYDGLFQGIRIERAFASELPAGARGSRADPARHDQSRGQRGRGARRRARRPGGDGARRAASSSRRSTTRRNGVVRLVVADNGPGIPAADREKLFMPYYSTKRRGSGLGLAIVRRIIVEHGGSIEVGDNAPTGTRFTIELPA